MIDNTAMLLQPNALESLVDTVDQYRTDANQLLDQSTRGQKGQFMTPASVAQILSGMFRNLDGEVRVLDAGAGVGSLTASLVARAMSEIAPTSISGNMGVGNVLVERLRIRLADVGSQPGIRVAKVI